MLNDLIPSHSYCEPHPYNAMIVILIENSAYLWTQSEDIFIFLGCVILFIVICWRIGKKGKDAVQSNSYSDMACIF